MIWRFALGAAVAGACGLLAACTTYEGTKLDPSGALPANQTVGIPYMLTRPEFVVKEEGGKYSVTPVPVPDPQQRYTLRMSPAMFADVDFTIMLNATGGVQSIDGKITDKVQPTVKAFVELAAKMKGVMLANTDYGGGRSSLVCADVETPARHARCILEKIDVKDCKPAFASLIERLDRDFIGKDEKKDKQDFAALFHYETDKEQECLAAAGKAWGDLVKEYVEVWKKKAADLPDTTVPEKAFASRIGGIWETADSRGARRLTRAVDVADDIEIDAKTKEPELSPEVRFRRLRRELELKPDVPLQESWFTDCVWRTALTGTGISLPPGDRCKPKPGPIQKLADQLKNLDEGPAAAPPSQPKPATTPPTPQEPEVVELEPGTSASPTGEPAKVAAKAPIAIAALASQTAKTFTAIAEAKPDSWRARRLARYDATIDALKFKLQQYEALNDPRAAKDRRTEKDRPTENDQRIANTRDELNTQQKKRAALLLMTPERLQLEAIQKRLENLPKPRLDARQSAMDEYKKERAEADALAARIEGRAEAVAAAGKAKEAAPPLLSLIAERTYPLCVAASKLPGWFETDGPAAPEFVVVLRPLSGARDLFEPKQPEECP